jgi:NAD(P)H-hydrate epimerase
MIDLPVLPERPADSHKGDFGLALLIGGSRGMTGAIGLAGMAALRGGAGLVRLAVPDVCLNVAAGFEPSYMTIPLPSDEEGRIVAAAREKIIQLAKVATVVGLGPGLGRSRDIEELVGWLYENIAQPMVVDADALTALSVLPQSLARPGGPRILTPHPGEFARLLHRDKVPPVERSRAAVDLARQCGVVLVLKGHRTLVTDGTTEYFNSTGNPGMATGGSGDVLTGLIVALLCQHLAALDAARLGVFLHGLAGDLAAGELGQESMIASDLIRFLPAAFREYRKRLAG